MADTIAEGVSEARALASSVVRRASLALVAALLAATGVSFLLWAGYLRLVRHLGPEDAKLVFGAALLTCAAVLFLVARRKRRARKPAAARTPATTRAEPAPAPAAPPGEVELAPLAAFVVAFVVARQLRRRQAP